MNAVECLLVVQKVLKRFFGDNNVHRVIIKPGNIDKNKIYYTITLKNDTHNGFLYYNERLTVKDVKNILFKYRENILKTSCKDELEEV